MRRLLRAWLLMLPLVACGHPSGSTPPPTVVAAIPGTQVLMDFTGGSGFYGSPFPSDNRRTPGGVDLSGFPNPTHNGLVNDLVVLANTGIDGFGLSSGIFLQTTAALSPAIQGDPHASVDPTSAIFLLGITPTSPDYLQRLPITVSLESGASPFGAPNLLTALPLQGVPLRAHSSYALAILRSAGDAQGQPLGVSLSMAQLAAGEQPSGLSSAALPVFQQALDALTLAGVPPSEVAGMTAFTTWDPTAGMEPYLQDVLSRPLPVPNAPWVRDEVFPGYCVYQTTIDMPDYQQGTPPYSPSGGSWGSDGGAPLLQGMETANMVITVPRRAMPDGGFPIVMFSRTGGGGDRPLVDRGPQGVPGGPALIPGTGPAMMYAQAGFAGMSIDGPLGGLRNPTGNPANEDNLIFNVTNPVAMRDNLRQSALEMVLWAHLIEKVQIDPSECPGISVPGGGPVTFNRDEQVIMGHSMGATISPLALAEEPRYKAAIFSGAGGSWIENVVYKQEPLVVLPVAEVVLDIPASYTLTEFDPILSLLQWVGEPADPPMYARKTLREPGPSGPKHVLMLQGIVDTYILPPIANAESLSLGLDLAGPPLDASCPQEAEYTPLEDLVGLAGNAQIPLPASGNRLAGDGSQVTAVVVQHLKDAIENGHEVVFQTEAPKFQYRCFLQSLLQGRPSVPPNGTLDQPCP